MTELYDGRGSTRPVAGPRRTAPWIAVAIVAIVAGVSTATIGPEVRQPSPAAAPGTVERVRGISPKMVELTFNPRVPRGLKVAKVAFRFTFEHAAGDREMVRQRIESRWEVMIARVLRCLTRRSPDELKLDGGIDAIELDLRATIGATLFDDGISQIHEILWEQILVQ